ncbi:MAG: SLBB domain-containing protein, partial [Mesotoga sp.]|uniref:SLBB domain-containing protein n=1 Tax=Mesotoga sp. TaxID=2053577 RepID=UPI003569728A
MRVRIISLSVLLLLTVFLFGYSVRPGDLLTVSVYGSADLSSEALVGPDGTASVRPLGNVMLLGKTLEEIQSLLSSQFLSQGILTSKPQVTVSVKSFAPFMFYVLGEVSKPGAIEWHDTTIGISQLLALAGGLRDGADLSSSFVVGKDGSRKQIDLSSILYGGAALTERLLEGSTLFVPAGARAWIMTMGEFRSPTLVKFNPGITLTQVIAKSGGLTEGADNEEILLISDDIEGNTTTINLNAILSGRDKDIQLPAGSIVIANDSSSKSVKLLGEFNNPASIPYHEKLTLLQAIGKVGGLRQTASDELYILRIGLTVPESVEVSSLFSGSVEDISLNPGDTIFVPRQQERFVYIASASFGGKVEFSTDEKLSLLSALVKVDLYDPTNQDSIVVVEPSGERLEFSQKEDAELEPGSMIILPRGEKNVFVTGEVMNPGSIPFANFEEITLAKAIAKSGGVTESAG